MRGIEDTLSSKSVVVATADQISCELEGEAAILNLSDGVYYGLDEVGACVWNLLQQPRRVDQIRDALLEQYEVDAPRCERDLFTLLSELLERGLIEVRDASAA